MAAIDIHARELAGRITFAVRGLKGFIAAWCFKLGARIAGVGIVIER